jgi:methylenetetrahydrofolate reductase (NADPH)
MNLAQATQAVLEELRLIPSEETPLQRPLPWRPSLALNRRGEDVRPIFWRNRNSSYIARTQTWDEFPNGRWTDSRSPAFGELDAYGIGLKGTNEQNIKLWGEPKSIRDVTQIFVRYLEGKLDRLPWSDSPISGEANAIKDNLVQLNSRGLLTVNSQPAVNGVRSSHPVYGWGPKNGFVYQKAYLELFVPPYLLDELIARIEKNPDLTYHAVAKNRELRTNTRDSPNALTWGIFAGREIVQPTIVETISFLAWKDEAYRLGEDWAKCHDASSPSRKLIQDIMDNWYLVNIGKFAIAPCMYSNC